MTLMVNLWYLRSIPKLQSLQTEVTPDLGDVKVGEEKEESGAVEEEEVMKEARLVQTAENLRCVAINT